MGHTDEEDPHRSSEDTHSGGGHSVSDGGSDLTPSSTKPGLNLPALPGGEDSAKKDKEEDGEDGEDTEDGHVVHREGLLLKGRYEVVSLLGGGAFGKVLECRDRNTGEHVAVKVLRNIKCFQESGRSEVAVLQEINQLDDEHVFGCVRMLDWFDHQGHVCIVLELLGMNTSSFIQQNHHHPFTVPQIRHMAFTLCRTVCFLHRHKLTHTDLKPENILLVSPDHELDFSLHTRTQCRTVKCVDVKLVDFGSAAFDGQHHQSVVSTRHYRAPEIILDLGWNQSCDVWSLGCVLMEFYLGHTLFPTHNSQEHLAMMEKVLGPIPTHLLEQTRKQHLVSEGLLRWDGGSCSDDYILNHCRPLKSEQTFVDWLQHMLSSVEQEEDRHLLDLISLMLEYDVNRRITLQEALWHPFFKVLHKQS